MSCGGEGDFRAPIKSGLSNTHIVSCDDDGIQIAGQNRLFPDLAQKRFAINEMQWFSRKTCGIPAGRNDPNGLIHSEGRE
jgi:hypothetical protein